MTGKALSCEELGAVYCDNANDNAGEGTKAVIVVPAAASTTSSSTTTSGTGVHEFFHYVLATAVLIIAVANAYAIIRRSGTRSQTAPRATARQRSR